MGLFCWKSKGGDGKSVGGMEKMENESGAARRNPPMKNYIPHAPSRNIKTASPTRPRGGPRVASRRTPAGAAPLQWCVHAQLVLEFHAMQSIQSPTTSKNRVTSAATAVDKLWELFSKYDKDDSGFVDVAEFAHLIR